MTKLGVAALRDCLCQDLESARTRLRELSPEELKELSRACMTLQNLTSARLYAIAQQTPLRRGSASDDGLRDVAES